MMKKLLLLIGVGYCCTLFAQSTESVTPRIESQPVALTAVVTDGTIPASAAKQLVNKMQQIVLKSGCAGINKSRFVITCSVDELSKQVVTTAPLMYAYTLNFNFYIGDGVEGVLFSSTSIEAKGAGESEAKAYLSALKSIQPNNPVFKPFVEKGKKRIEQYYAAIAAASAAAQPAAPTDSDSVQVTSPEQEPAVQQQPAEQQEPAYMDINEWQK